MELFRETREKSVVEKEFDRVQQSPGKILRSLAAVVRVVAQEVRRPGPFFVRWVTIEEREKKLVDQQPIV